MPHHGEPWDDDFELISHILCGSTAHWDLLYQTYFPRVYRFALKRLRDPEEAADATQECSSESSTPSGLAVGGFGLGSF